MNNYPQSITTVIDQFKKLPGIGSKSAERITLHLLAANRQDTIQLSNAIINLKNRIRYCKQCFYLSEQDLCNICNQPNRDPNVICVVENPKDIQAVEKTRKYRGHYHVLLGKISPLEGISPEKLKINELLHRIQHKKPQEIILATSADIEGESTALYLTKVIKPLGIKISRIAYGIPVGSSLEFTDEATLMRAMDGRQTVSQ